METYPTLRKDDFTHLDQSIHDNNKKIISLRFCSSKDFHLQVIYYVYEQSPFLDYIRYEISSIYQKRKNLAYFHVNLSPLYPPYLFLSSHFASQYFLTVKTCSLVLYITQKLQAQLIHHNTKYWRYFVVTYSSTFYSMKIMIFLWPPTNNTFIKFCIFLNLYLKKFFYFIAFDAWQKR